MNLSLTPTKLPFKLSALFRPAFRASDVLLDSSRDLNVLSPQVKSSIHAKHLQLTAFLAEFAVLGSVALDLRLDVRGVATAVRATIRATAIAAIRAELASLAFAFESSISSTVTSSIAPFTIGRGAIIVAVGIARHYGSISASAIFKLNELALGLILVFRLGAVVCWRNCANGWVIN